MATPTAKAKSKTQPEFIVGLTIPENYPHPKTEKATKTKAATHRHIQTADHQKITKSPNLEKTQIQKNENSSNPSKPNKSENREYQIPKKNENREISKSRNSKIKKI